MCKNIFTAHLKLNLINKFLPIYHLKMIFLKLQEILCSLYLSTTNTVIIIDPYYTIISSVTLTKYLRNMENYCMITISIKKEFEMQECICNQYIIKD